MLFTQLVQANLTTINCGRNIEYFTKTESTNDDAWELYQENAPTGSVVVAEIQTKGRGRQGNKWHTSPDKGLAFSILLRPKISISASGIISAATAVAIQKALTEYDIESKTKWPNDILINDKKVGGILCESRISGNHISALVIGVGLNVNHDSDDFSEDIADSSTSLFIEKGISFQRERILASILNQLESVMAKISNNEIDEIIHDWESNCSHMLKDISIRDQENTHFGTFMGINSKGSALLNVDGKQIDFNSGLVIKTDEDQMI